MLEENVDKNVETSETESIKHESNSNVNDPVTREEFDELRNAIFAVLENHATHIQTIRNHLIGKENETNAKTPPSANGINPTRKG